MSVLGPSATSGNVRFSAAVGGEADITRPPPATASRVRGTSRPPATRPSSPAVSAGGYCSAATVTRFDALIGGRNAKIKGCFHAAFTRLSCDWPRRTRAGKCLIPLLLQRTNADGLLGRPPIAVQLPATTTDFDDGIGPFRRIEVCAIAAEFAVLKSEIA